MIMECTECGASGYGLHHSAACKYLNIDIYKKAEQQAMRIQELEAVCHREGGVLTEALKRKNNKSMIKVVAESLREQAQKGGVG